MKTAKWIRDYVLPLIFLILILVLAAKTCRIHFLLSGSMEPVYPTGTILVISSLPEPKQGDVCAYRHNGKTVVHRIIDINDAGYVFKGDANNVRDPYLIQKGEIEGNVLFALPHF